MKIRYSFRNFCNRLKSACKVLTNKTIVLYVDREEVPLDVIVLYSDEIAFYGEGPLDMPMGDHQIKAINEFKKAWVDSYSKSFSGKEDE